MEEIAQQLQQEYAQACLHVEPSQPTIPSIHPLLVSAPGESHQGRFCLFHPLKE